MRHDIDALYHDGIRQEAERRFRFDRNRTKTLHGFESYVYDCQRVKQSFIMKITHTLRRSFDQIMGELEFVNYLADGGIPVPRAIQSVGGHLVERISADHGHFLAFATIKSSGHHIGKRELTPDVIRRWGALTGRMHALAKDFEPTSASYRRRHWHEDDYAQFERYIPSGETRVLQQAHQLYYRLHALPKDRDTYGLIHKARQHILYVSGHLSRLGFLAKITSWKSSFFDLSYCDLLHDVIV